MGRVVVRKLLRQYTEPRRGQHQEEFHFQEQMAWFGLLNMISNRAHGPFLYTFDVLLKPTRAPAKNPPRPGLYGSFFCRRFADAVLMKAYVPPIAAVRSLAKGNLGGSSLGMYQTAQLCLQILKKRQKPQHSPWSACSGLLRAIGLRSR